MYGVSALPMREDILREWCMTDLSKGAMTVQSMQDCSIRKRNNYSCVSSGIFSNIPIDNVIPDILHLFLRISDQLNNEVVLELIN